MDPKLKIILLAGPTSSGKSQLAINLSKSLDGEIINADSMQIYKEFNILTSRPTAKDIKKAKHHLYGIISVKKDFSTGKWLKLVSKLIKKILKKNKIPIIVGGTGLYFKALIEGLAKIPNIPIKLRNKIRRLHKNIGQKRFYEELLKLDPDAKKYIESKDIQRSIRAYEVKKYTKKSLYIWFENTKPNFDQFFFKKLFINLSREELLKKIHQRVEKMFKKGAEQEVKKFAKLKIKTEMSANKIIGVQEIKNYLQKKITLNQAKELIKIRTRQYAKRQATWARGQMSTWETINPQNYKEIIKKIVN